MAKQTNWQELREQLPHRYTKQVSEMISAFISENADAARKLGYVELKPRQVECVFKGEIKDSLKVACVLRFSRVLKAQYAPVRKMLSSQITVKKMKASKV
jgi:hypothetical protein